MWLMIAWTLFGFSVLLALAEIYNERDWPRCSFRYVLIFGAVLAMSLGQ
jgi:hypothetical protein